MIEILPNWHPVFVHFTVALLTISVALFLAAKMFPGASWNAGASTVARWNLYLGAGFAVVTMFFGWLAFNSVAHDDAAHLAMIDHRTWAIGAGLSFVVLATWMRMRFENTGPNGVFLSALVMGFVLLSVTAFKGGELVYRHGLGVLSLPDVSADAGAGGDGHDHDHDEPVAEVPADAEAGGDGHDHEHDTAAAGGDAGDVALASEGPAGAVNAFHAALKAGDPILALSYLAEDALIYESGNAERSRAEYESSHLEADMAFSVAMDRQVVSQRVIERGDSATVVSESLTQGMWGEREINSAGVETIVLERHDTGWKIVHIHWSSRSLTSN